MTHIIISYRRADSDAIAGRIKDRLTTHFGDESIFMDIDSIPFGFDFREHIQEALAQNDMVVAIIGPKWSGPMKGGQARIMEETDPVRIEIESALKYGKVVIPVLVAGATMPDPADLPEGLRALAFRNAAEVDAGRDFHQHVDRLIRSMDMILAKSKPKVAVEAPAAIPAATVATTAPRIERPPTSADYPIEVRTPVVPPPQAAPAAPPAAISAPAMVAAVPPKRRSWAPWIAAACFVLVAGGLGIGAWVFWPATPKTEVAKNVPGVPTTTSPTLGGAATGCKMPVATFHIDNFKEVDQGWLLPAQNTAYYVDGQLALSGLEGKISRVLYPPFRYKNVSVCAEVRTPTQLADPEGTGNAGVMFWATDASNFYMAAVYPNGTYSIYRMASDNWASVALRTPFAGIKQGAGALNQVQVTTKDNVGTLFINGERVQEFRGQPPRDGSAIGLYSSSSSNERNEWRFQSVAVADLDHTQARPAAKAPAPQITTGCKPSRAVAFEDKFKSQDPGWGVNKDSASSFVDGQLAIKAQPNKVWEQFYPSLLFKSATVCAHLRSPLQMNDPDGTSQGGLVFWGINRTNYYTAYFYPNGQVGIWRMVNSSWAKILGSVKSDAIKTGLGMVNETMVSFGTEVAAFYVNGQKVYEFRGQPPATGGSVGLFAGSEKENQNEWRVLDITVVENE